MPKYVLTEKNNHNIVVISDTLEHQENGNPLVHNGTLAIGYPVDEWTVDEVPDYVKPSIYQYDGQNFTYSTTYPFEAVAKERRDKELQETDWTQVLDAQISKESQEAMRIYRQALRDITKQENYPHEIVWPARPPIVSGAVDPVDTAFDQLMGSSEEVGQ